MSGDRPGSAFLAVNEALSPDGVMSRLQAAALPCRLIQIHPEDESDQQLS
jgi:hypothetical protein